MHLRSSRWCSRQTRGLRCFACGKHRARPLAYFENFCASVESRHPLPGRAHRDQRHRPWVRVRIARATPCEGQRTGCTVRQPVPRRSPVRSRRCLMGEPSYRRRQVGTDAGRGHAKRSARYSRPGVGSGGTARAHSSRTNAARGSGPVSAGSGVERRGEVRGVREIDGEPIVSRAVRIGRSGNAAVSTAPKPVPPPSMHPRHPNIASRSRRRIWNRSVPPHDGQGPTSSPERSRHGR